MEKTVLAKPKSGISEYRLLISPDDVISSFTWRVKRPFSKRYRDTNAHKSAPHITIASFLLSDKLESGLVSSLKEFAKTASPFGMEVNGFGKFKTKTIFLKIADTQAFSQLSSNVKRYISRYLNKSWHFSTLAHLTITRDLNEEQLQRAWQDWKGENFQASFEANEMILLRRPFEGDNNSKFEKVATFDFQGKDPSGNQLSLKL